MKWSPFRCQLFSDLFIRLAGHQGIGLFGFSALMLVHEANQPPTNFNDSGDTTVFRDHFTSSSFRHALTTKNPINLNLPLFGIECPS